MGGVYVCFPRTCRAAWPLLLILAATPRVLVCSGSQAAAGKTNPRANHWAVGHLMGKKSIEIMPELQETNSDYLKPAETAIVTEVDRYEGLMEALMQQQNQKRMMSKTADRLFRLHSWWRHEDRDKYLRKALRLQDNDSI